MNYNYSYNSLINLLISIYLYLIYYHSLIHPIYISLHSHSLISSLSHPNISYSPLIIIYYLITILFSSYISLSIRSLLYSHS